MIRRILLTLLVTLVSAGTLPAEEESAAADSRQRTVAAINRIREDADLPVLVEDSAAMESAALHAEELAARLSLSHVSLDGSRVADRYRAAGGTALRAGENLGAGESVERIISAWLDSPGHRDNLMNPGWRKIGVGVHILNSGRRIIVAVFTDSRFELLVPPVLLSREPVTSPDSAPSYQIEGEFLLSQGSSPTEMGLSYRGDFFSPLSAVVQKDGALKLTFQFNEPAEWQENRPAPFFFSFLENSVSLTSDLVFLSRRIDFVCVENLHQ